MEWTRNPDYYWPRPFEKVNGVFGAVTSNNYTDFNLQGMHHSKIAGWHKSYTLHWRSDWAGPGTANGHWWIAWNILDTRDGINGPFTVPGGANWATANPPIRFTDTGFSSFHPGGCHFAMCDGSVQFLSQDIAQDVLAALTTRAGAEVVNEQF